MIDQTVDFLRPVGTDADNRNIISQFALMAKGYGRINSVGHILSCIELEAVRKKRISFFSIAQPRKKKQHSDFIIILSVEILL